MAGREPPADGGLWSRGYSCPAHLPHLLPALSVPHGEASRHHPACLCRCPQLPPPWQGTADRPAHGASPIRQDWEHALRNSDAHLGFGTSNPIVTQMALPVPHFAASSSARLVQRRRVKRGRAAGQKPRRELRLTQFSQILVAD